MDPAAVQRVARLARLDLDPAELARATRALAALLQDIAVLRDLSADELPTPVAGHDAGPGPVSPDALHVPVASLAPDWRDGFFTVPPGTAGRPPASDG